MVSGQLWECPACGRRFVTVRMWHSCVVRDVDSFFLRHRHLQPVYVAFEEVARSIAPISVDVAKTRITFTARTRFAAVVRLRRDAIVAQFWLPREERSERIFQADHVGDDWIHQVLLRSESDVDDQLRTWLTEAHRVAMLER